MSASTPYTSPSHRRPLAPSARYSLAAVGLGTLGAAAAGIMLVSQSRPMPVEPGTQLEPPTSGSASILPPRLRDRWYLDRSSAANGYLPLDVRRDAWFLEPSSTTSVSVATTNGFRVMKDRWYKDIQQPAPSAWSSPLRDRWYLDPQFVATGARSAADTHTIQQPPIPTHDDWAVESNRANSHAQQVGGKR
jgi:hypothetical protein